MAEAVGVSAGERRRRQLVFVSTSIGQYIVGANLSTVNIATPEIRAHFDVSVTSVGWITTAYAIFFASCLVPAGRVADRYGRRTVYMAGLLAFTIGSVISGVGPSLWLVVLGRAVQGVGAALYTPSGIGLLLEVTPEKDRTRMLALSGIFSSAGVATGPTLGALIVDGLNWRWSFLIAPPVALASYLVGANALPKSKGNPNEPRVDIAGIALAIVSMSLLTLGISEGRIWGWTSAATLLSIAGGLALFGAFIGQCRRSIAPVLPLGLFRSRVYSAATATGLLYGIASGSILFVNVFFLRNVWEYDTFRAGIAMVPGPVVASFTAPFAGRFGTRYGERAVTIPGLLILALGIGLYVLLTGSEPHYWADWFVGASLTGMGVMLVFPMLSGAAVKGVKPEMFSVATGSLRGAVQFGQAAGVALVVAVLGSNPTDAGEFHVAWLLLVACCVLAAVCALGLRPPRSPNVHLRD